MQDTELAQMANDHWRTTYRGLIAGLGGEWREFGAVDAFVTPGVPASFANGTLVLGAAARDDLAGAIEWVAASGQPFSVRVDARRAPGVLDVPVALGLKRHEWMFPGMVMAPIAASPPLPPGVSTAVVDDANHDDFIGALVDQGMAREFARAAFGMDALRSPDVRFLVAYLDGRPVGNAVVVRTGDVSGVYAVGVVEEARRRGIGSAVTWAAVDQARAWQSAAVFLQSTQMGYGIYSAMGFRTVVEYAWFARPLPDGSLGSE